MFSNHFLSFFTLILVLSHQTIIAIDPIIRHIHTKTLNARVVNNELQAMNNPAKARRIHRIRIQYQPSTFNLFTSKLSIIIITHLTAITIHNMATNTKIMNSPAHGKHNNNNQINAVRIELTPINVLSSSHVFLIANAVPTIQKIKA